MRVAQAYFDVLAAQDALATTQHQQDRDRRATGLGQAQFRGRHRHHHRHARSAGPLRPAQRAGHRRRERPAQQAPRARPAGRPQRRRSPRPLAVPVRAARRRVPRRRRRMGHRAPTRCTRSCARRGSALDMATLETEKARAGRPADRGRWSALAGARHGHAARLGTAIAGTTAQRHRSGVQLNWPLFAGGAIAEPHQGNPVAGGEVAQRPGSAPPQRGAEHARRLLRRAVAAGAGEGAGGGRIVEPSSRSRPRSWATRSACASTSTC